MTSYVVLNKDKDQELLDLVDRTRRAHKAYLKAQTNYTKLKNAVQALMGDTEILYDTDGVELITWKYGKDTLKFQQTEFKQAHPDIYKEFCTEEKGSRSFIPK